MFVSASHVFVSFVFGFIVFLPPTLLAVCFLSFLFFCHDLFSLFSLWVLITDSCPPCRCSLWPRHMFLSRRNASQYKIWVSLVATVSHYFWEPSRNYEWWVSVGPILGEHWITVLCSILLFCWFFGNAYYYGSSQTLDRSSSQVFHPPISLGTFRIATRLSN